MTKPDLESEPRQRRVRSFVRRPGRMTPAQQTALSTLLPIWSVEPSLDDLRLAFANEAPLIVEIGFGNGDALAAMARSEPSINFIGIEVHEPGVGHLLRRINELELNNVRIAMTDAVEVLERQARPASLLALRIYFPDPWPKKRHHKRRLIQHEFLELAATRLQPGGRLHVATDWQPYADWILERVAEVPEFQLQGSPYVERPDWRPQTRFETRGEARGHAIRDIVAIRRDTSG